MNTITDNPENIRFIKYTDMNSEEHFHYYGELLYIMSGSYYININKAATCTKKGDFILIMPNETHSVHIRTNGEVFCMQFSSDVIPQFSNILVDYSLCHNVKAYSQMSCISHSSINTALKLSQAGHSREAAPSEFSTPADISLKTGLLLILLSDMTDKNLVRKKTSIQNKYCQAALDYIEHHYTEDLSLNAIASNLGINQSYLSRLFSSSLHITCSEYITNRRLEHAKTLILHTCKSIVSIMLEAGFNSERTFYRCFKKRYGFTPSELRSCHGNTI